MKYHVIYAPGTEKQLSRLQLPLRSRIADAISALAENPRPHGCKKLMNRNNQYRIRVRDYRIIYTINDGIVTVRVLEIDHRRDIYR